MGSKRNNRSSLTKATKKDFRIAKVTPGNGYNADACERHQQEAMSAPIGSYIKFGLTPRGSEGSEWVWGQLVKRTGKRLTVILANQPFMTNARYGDRFEISLDNVFVVEPGS